VEQIVPELLRLVTSPIRNEIMTTLHDAYQIVRDFESAVAEYTGSKYAVAVDTGTAALFLCCKYLQVKEVTIPKRTYCSVPCAIIHAGGTVKFEPDSDYPWRGAYWLAPYPIVDAACRFRRGMYRQINHEKVYPYVCLSFQYRKHLNIGRGGMILTNDAEAVEWFKKARFNGRSEVPMTEDKPTMIGWSCYMEPERAAIGLTKLAMMPDHNDDLVFNYPDLSTWNLYDRPNVPVLR